MIAFTIGFRSTQKDSEAVALYVGQDGAEALRVAQSNPPGFEMCLVFKNPAPVKRTYSDGTGELPAALREQTLDLKLELSDEFKAAVSEAVEKANADIQVEIARAQAEFDSQRAADAERIKELEAALAEATKAPETPAGEETAPEGGADADKPEGGEGSEQPPLEGLAGSLKPRSKGGK